MNVYVKVVCYGIKYLSTTISEPIHLFAKYRWRSKHSLIQSQFWIVHVIIYFYCRLYFYIYLLLFSTSLIGHNHLYHHDIVLWSWYENSIGFFSRISCKITSDTLSCFKLYYEIVFFMPNAKYNRNIVESGTKHHKFKPTMILFTVFVVWLDNAIFVPMLANKITLLDNKKCSLYDHYYGNGWFYVFVCLFLSPRQHNCEGI